MNSCGYEILKHRYKTPFGEIDVIAQENDTIVFCEVKFRKKFKDALEAISERQKSRVLAAAEIFIRENEKICEGKAFRFDAILLNDFRMEHIENAWLSNDIGVTAIGELNGI